MLVMESKWVLWYGTDLRTEFVNRNLLSLYTFKVRDHEVAEACELQCRGAMSAPVMHERST